MISGYGGDGLGGMPFADRAMGAVRVRLVPMSRDAVEHAVYDLAHRFGLGEEQDIEMPGNSVQGVSQVDPQAAVFAVVGEPSCEGGEDEAGEQLLPDLAHAVAVEALDREGLPDGLVQLLDAPALVVEPPQFVGPVAFTVNQHGAEEAGLQADAIAHPAQAQRPLRIVGLDLGIRCGAGREGLDSGVGIDAKAEQRMDAAFDVDAQHPGREATALGMPLPG